MMGIIFSGVTLSAVLVATFIKHTKYAILALWVAGLGVGAIYLALGAEFLAIIQWIISTLSTITFVFFAVMFGEYNAVPPKGQKNGIILLVLSMVLGILFSVIVSLGTRSLPQTFLVEPVSENDLGVIGRALTQENLLSLEVLALTLFLILVGGGVIARYEGDES